MAWSDYGKAYDMIPHSWIIEGLEMFGIAENVKKFMIDKIGIKIINSRLWSCEAFKVNHLLSMDALKLFRKSEDQVDSLVQTVEWLREDIGM